MTTTSFVSSKHLRGTSELLVQAPIRTGLVPVSDTLTYTTRLATLLESLFALRQTGVEAYAGSVAGPLDKVRSLHFVQWAILNGGRDLLLAVTFDGAWETYIRDVYAAAGEFLDVIFCHCEGFPIEEGSARGPAFAAWVRSHQVRCSYFHSATPTASSDDLRYLQDFENLQARARVPGDLEKDLDALRVGAALEKPSARRPELFIAVVNGLYRLLEAFPAAPSPPHPSYGCDRLVYERAAATELGHLLPAQLDDTLRALMGTAAGQWAHGLMARAKAAAEKANADPGPPEAPPLIGPLRDNLQGNILTGYEGMSRGCVAFLQFDRKGDFEAFASQFQPTLEGDATADPVRKNVAFTFGGLARWALDEEAIALLPAEFREGMEARAGFLGDIGPNHPRNWAYPLANWPPANGAAPLDPPPVPLTAVDAVVILQHRNDDRLWSEGEPLCAALRSLEAKSARVLAVQPLRRNPDRAAAAVTTNAAGGTWDQATGGAAEGGQYFREHFGFLDGFSQPVPRVRRGDAPAAVPPSPNRDEVPLGELFLGFPNLRGENVFAGHPIFDQGSFVAMRKLAQRVDDFEALKASVLAAAGQAGTVGKETADYYLGKIMGRTPEGARLTKGSTPGALGGTGNDFDYQQDPKGEGCPLHAHARRANPRERPDPASGPLPRIMRRGFSFDDRAEDRTHRTDEGPDEDARGLLFVAYNASLAGQFEAIQGWLSGGNSTGILSRQRDLVTGVHGVEDQGRFYSFVDQERVVRFPAPTRPLVRVCWGLYLFAPALSGLRALGRAATAKKEPGPASIPPNAPANADLDPLPVKVARQFLASLENLPDRMLQTMFEDRGFTEINEAFWTLLREREGDAPGCPLGQLVSRSDEVLAVLGNVETHSVRPYGARMQSSFGPLYLGFDTNTDAYRNASEAPNAFIAAIGAGDAYLLAKALMAAALAGAPRVPHPPPPLGTTSRPRCAVDLTTFFGPIVYELSARWFGVPSSQKEGFPGDFHLAAEYIFHPHPGDALALNAEVRGPLLRAAFFEYVRGELAKPVGSTGSPPRLLDVLRSSGSAFWTEEQIAQAVLGAINGFVVPTSGSFESVMNQWIEGGDLWHQQQARRGRKDDARWLASRDAFYDDPLVRAVLGAMRRRPVPDLLHRARVSDGKPVVVSLASAAATDPRPEVLFGGSRPAQPHSCPGMDMAVGVIVGMVEALLERTDVRRETVMVLSFDA